MISRLLSMIVKETLELRRDRLTLAMMAVLPLVMLLLFGYAINTDIRHIPLVVYDQDHSAESRDFVARLVGTGFYDDKGAADSYDDIARALRGGQAHVAIVFGPTYACDLSRGASAEVQLIVDGADPQTVASALNTASGLAESRSADFRLLRLSRLGAAAAPEPIQLQTLTWYNPDLRTAVYVVPGLIGVLLTMTMVMITSMAITRERERGTLEQLIVSPLRRWELILGKIIPFIKIGYIQMTFILLLGRLVFDVPFVGSPALLYALAIGFIAGNLAIGVFLSTLAATQQQAMQMSFFFLLPNILLSGFMFPWDAMPPAARALSQALPLTHFLRIVRAIMLKGGGFSDVGPEFAWLLAIFCVLVVLAAARFRKKLG